MTSPKVSPVSIPLDYSRVERDDRLFDILPVSETREKGVDLWEKWTAETVTIIRLRHGQTTHHILPREQIEKALTTYQKIPLT